MYGHFGEASKSVADLQTYIAESMAAAHWQELGYITRDHAKGCIRTDIRLKCSLVQMRKKAHGLITGMRHVHGAECVSKAPAEYHRQRRAAYSRAYRAGGGGAQEHRHFRAKHARRAPR